MVSTSTCARHSNASVFGHPFVFFSFLDSQLPPPILRLVQQQVSIKTMGIGLPHTKNECVFLGAYLSMQSTYMLSMPIPSSISRPHPLADRAYVPSSRDSDGFSVPDIHMLYCCPLFALFSFFSPQLPPPILRLIQQQVSKSVSIGLPRPNNDHETI